MTCLSLLKTEVHVKVGSVILALAVALSGIPALCSADVATGTINLIEMNSGLESARVYLNNVTTMCSGGASNFAYVSGFTDGSHTPDINYNAMVATLLSAKVTQATVDIYTSLDATTGYCHIYDIVLH
jgi:hypothetical protein